jgi:Protein of unknown function (DUF4236)
MGFRTRKSIKLAPGVRLNVSKKGIGMSAGAGGVRYSAHSSGRRTVSARTGIPGVTYQKSVQARKGRRTVARPASGSITPPKPGIFAPKGEKQLFKAIQADDVAAIKRVGEEHPDFRIGAWSLAGPQLITDDPTEATRLLDAVFQTGADPAEDRFISKYLYTRLTLGIAAGVTAEVPVSRDAVGLALAELKQQAGDINSAIEVVEQLEPTTYAAVSLAELYALAGRYDDVIALSDGIKTKTTQARFCFATAASPFVSRGFMTRRTKPSRRRSDLVRGLRRSATLPCLNERRTTSPKVRRQWRERISSG